MIFIVGFRKPILDIYPGPVPIEPSLLRLIAAEALPPPIARHAPLG